MRQTKQVILVRKDLEMPAGKIGAQVAHASLAVILDLIREDIIFPEGGNLMPIDDKYTPVGQWLNGSFTKVCLGVKSEIQMENIHQLAKLKGIPTSWIVDDGRTVFDGVKTATCCAIGPWWSDEIDEITGRLRLY